MKSALAYHPLGTLTVSNTLAKGFIFKIIHPRLGAGQEPLGRVILHLGDVPELPELREFLCEANQLQSPPGHPVLQNVAKMTWR